MGFRISFNWKNLLIVIAVTCAPGVRKAFGIQQDSQLRICNFRGSTTWSSVKESNLEENFQNHKEKKNLHFQNHKEKKSSYYHANKTHSQVTLWIIPIHQLPINEIKIKQWKKEAVFRIWGHKLHSHYLLVIKPKMKCSMTQKPKSDTAIAKDPWMVVSLFSNVESKSINGLIPTRKIRSCGTML